MTARITRGILPRKEKHNGFSLIEIVVVIAVVAILGAIAIPKFMGVTDDASARIAQQAVLNAVKECQASKARRKTSLKNTFTASDMGDFVIFASNRGAAATDTDDKATIRAAILLRGNATQDQIVDDGEKGTAGVASTSCFDETGDLRDIYAVPIRPGKYPSFKSDPEGRTKCLSGDEDKFPEQYDVGCSAATEQIGKWR